MKPRSRLSASGPPMPLLRVPVGNSKTSYTRQTHRACTRCRILRVRSPSSFPLRYRRWIFLNTRCDAITTTSRRRATDAERVGPSARVVSLRVHREPNYEDCNEVRLACSFRDKGLLSDLGSARAIYPVGQIIIWRVFLEMHFIVTCPH